jgi:hypothetical protein
LSRKTQEIVERITQDRQGLLQAVEGLVPVQLDYLTAPDSWCISDVLHHLALADDAAARLMALMLERARQMALPPDPTPDGSVLDSIDAIVAPAEKRRARAPDRVAPRFRLPAAEALARLAVSRAKLLASVEALSGFDLSALTQAHPFFGDINTYQWLLITGWHERRHAAQIERIKSSPGFPP